MKIEYLNSSDVSFELLYFLIRGWNLSNTIFVIKVHLPKFIFIILKRIEFRNLWLILIFLVRVNWNLPIHLLCDFILISWLCDTFLRVSAIHIILVAHFYFKIYTIRIIKFHFVFQIKFGSTLYFNSNFSIHLSKKFC